jgi:hypothetical protein
MKKKAEKTVGKLSLKKSTIINLKRIQGGTENNLAATETTGVRTCGCETGMVRCKP